VSTEPDGGCYDEFVRLRLAAGDDPNVITGAIEEALMGSEDWTLFGDGNWRRNTVCSVCGHWMVGVCGPECKDVPGRAVILRREYVERSNA
jgi:hypothetical protein